MAPSWQEGPLWDSLNDVCTVSFVVGVWDLPGVTIVGKDEGEWIQTEREQLLTGYQEKMISCQGGEALPWVVLRSFPCPTGMFVPCAVLVPLHGHMWEFGTLGPRWSVWWKKKKENLISRLLLWCGVLQRWEYWQTWVLSFCLPQISLPKSASLQFLCTEEGKKVVFAFTARVTELELIEMHAAPSIIPWNPSEVDLCELGLALLWVTEQHPGVLGINCFSWVNGTFARGMFAYVAQEGWPLTGEINTWRFILLVVPSLVPCQSLGLIFFFP